MTDRRRLDHTWISNAAFARMTGIKFICLDCRLGVSSRRSPEARAECPGREEIEPHDHVWATTFGSGPDWEEHCVTCPASRSVLAKEPTRD